MWKTIKEYAGKLWRFLKELVKGSFSLFRKDLRRKYRNFHRMTPLQAGQVLKEESLCFFLSASKSLVASALRCSGSHKTATLTEALWLPYDDCFVGRRVSLLNCFATFGSQLACKTFNGYAPGISDRVSINMNLSQIASIVS